MARSAWPAQAAEDGARADDAAWREALSALADGRGDDLGESGVRNACQRFRHDAQARDDWHCWHLIGDALRSSDHCHGRGDVAFVAELRARLALEPVPMPAPAAAAMPADTAPAAVEGRAAGGNGAEVIAFPRTPVRRLWGAGLAGAAVAAGAAFVVGMAPPWMGGGVPGTEGSVVQAQAPRGPAGTAGGAPILVADTGESAPWRHAALAPETAQPVIRDVQLDRYLSAHRPMTAGGVSPGGYSVQLVGGQP